MIIIGRLACSVFQNNQRGRNEHRNMNAPSEGKKVKDTTGVDVIIFQRTYAPSTTPDGAAWAK